MCEEVKSVWGISGECVECEGVNGVCGELAVSVWSVRV